jgi:uncharacterized protein (DUF342 family)
MNNNFRDENENQMGEPKPSNAWTPDNIARLNALRRRLEDIERRDRDLKKRLQDLEDQYVEIRMKSLMRDLDKMLREQ